jgi:signal transduction histidine kinase
MISFLKTIFSKKFWQESSKYLLALFLIILFCVIALSLKTYFDSKKQLNDDLQTRINLISKSIRPFELNNLNASSEDLEKREYKDLKFKLESIRSVGTDLRFIYLLQERDNKIYFVADSEPDYSNDVSPAGQEYTEAEPVLVDYIKNGSKQDKANVVISHEYEDRWGKWISVYAPMRDASGRYFVIAADLDYSKAIESLWANMLIVATISVFLLLLILGMMYIRHEEVKVLKNKTLFVSLASHELRAPLTGLMWTTENLINSKTLSENDRDAISSVHDITKNLISMVNDFLSYITIDAVDKKIEWRKVLIIDLLKKSVSNLKSLADTRNIKIDTDGFENRDQCFVFADQTKLSSAFNNVISNAIKYSKDQGTVSISFSHSDVSAIIVFKDNGIGIKKADQQKVFDGMFRTEEAKKHTDQGTGLGLSFVKRVMSMHSGVVSLSSELDEGTEIKLIIPLTKNNLS